MLYKVDRVQNQSKEDWVIRLNISESKRDLLLAPINCFNFTAKIILKQKYRIFNYWFYLTKTFYYLDEISNPKIAQSTITTIFFTTNDRDFFVIFPGILIRNSVSKYCYSNVTDTVHHDDIPITAIRNVKATWNVKSRKIYR